LHALIDNKHCNVKMTSVIEISGTHKHWFVVVAKLCINYESEHLH